MNQERALSLLNHIFSDEDFGVNIMLEASVHENVYVIDYISSVCMAKVKEENNLEHLEFFTSVIEAFTKITINKIKMLEKLWIVYSKTTNYPYEVEGDILVLYTDDNIDLLKETFKRSYFDVEIKEIGQEVFEEEVLDLYRLGFQSIRLSDGKCKPLIVEKELLFHKGLKYDNAEITYLLIALSQERKRYNRALEDNTYVQELEMKLKKKIKTSVFTVTNNPMDNRILYAYTDNVEFRKMNLDSKDIRELKYSDILECLKLSEIEAIIINPMGARYTLTLKELL